MSFGARLERLVLVTTPLVTMAVVAVGLRIGGGQVTASALIYGAPRARGAGAFAWQLVSVVEDRGVREAQAARGLTVTATTRDGARARWQGDTDDDGVAELRLDLPDLTQGSPLHLEVLRDGASTPLAQGEVAWPSKGAPAVDASPRWASPTRTEGPLSVRLAIVGGALVPGFPVPVWAQVHDAAGKPVDAALALEPEPGLTLTPRAGPSCHASGGLELLAEASIHVVGAVLRASSSEGKTGRWAGVLPTTGGAMNLTLPAPRVNPGEEVHAVVTSSTARRTAYVEVDDLSGRAFGTTLSLHRDADGFARAEVTVPPLAAGLAWLVASGEPRGAETMNGATRAEPFLVGGAGEIIEGDACRLHEYLATHPAPRFPRFLALDGFAGTHEASRARQRGRALALLALALGGAIETLLLLGRAARARGGRRELDDALLGDSSAGASRSTSWGGARSAVVAVLLALLGFALLAALVARG